MAALEPTAQQATGNGRAGLTAAFDDVEQLPALADARDRVAAAANADPPLLGQLVDAVESDVALAAATVRLVNKDRKLIADRVATVADAIDAHGPIVTMAVATTAPTFELLADERRGSLSLEQFRLHALAVQRAADQIVRVTREVDSAELALAALLHDLGHLVIAELWPERNPEQEAVTVPPEERIAEERRRLHIDHALVGGVLTRRWKFPERIVAAIEQHHAGDATGLAAHIGLADMIAHYGGGDAVDPEAIERARLACGLPEDALRELLLTFPGERPRARPEECPLSPRELDVLEHLASGLAYEQIGERMGVSTSTVRSHLHNTYRKMDVADRAQAVIQARDFGWI